MPTRDNIYYDLEKSPFEYTYHDQIKFKFSSKLHEKKFCDKVFQNHFEIDAFLHRKYGITPGCFLMSLFVLYSKIENRGFLVTTATGGKATCLDQIILYGEKIMVKD